ncbi:hypothetical protein P692DRAFT_20382236 [Suillus brevipes Sb2]|nr:hypothetical protein P692DRAFT_20382236 [Suillus brevipes Sb2]
MLLFRKLALILPLRLKRTLVSSARCLGLVTSLGHSRVPKLHLHALLYASIGDARSLCLSAEPLRSNGTEYANAGSHMKAESCVLFLIF